MSTLLDDVVTLQREAKAEYDAKGYVPVIDTGISYDDLGYPYCHIKYKDLILRTYNLICYAAYDGYGLSAHAMDDFGNLVRSDPSRIRAYREGGNHD